MRVALAHPAEVGPDDRCRWAGWQDRDPRLANPFLSPTFAAVVGAVRPDARVAVVDAGKGPVAYWPLSLSRSGVAGPIAPHYTDLQGLVGAPGWTWTWRDLLGPAGLAGWTFDHLVGHQAAGLPATVRMAGSPVADLRDGWEAYRSWLQSRHKSVLAKNRSGLRRAESEHDVEFTEHDRRPDALAALFSLKSMQCRRNGWVDVFAPGWAREMTERAAASKSADMTGRLSTLRLDGKVVAVSLSLDSTRVRCLWFLAFDPEHAGIRPGTMLLLDSIHKAAGRGLDGLNFGKGGDRYKMQLGQDSDLLAAGCLRGPGRSGLTFSVGRLPSRLADAAMSSSPEADGALRAAVQRVRRARYAAGRR